MHFDIFSKIDYIITLPKSKHMSACLYINPHTAAGVLSWIMVKDSNGKPTVDSWGGVQNSTCSNMCKLCCAPKISMYNNIAVNPNFNLTKFEEVCQP